MSFVNSETKTLLLALLCDPLIFAFQSLFVNNLVLLLLRKCPLGSKGDLFERKILEPAGVEVSPEPGPGPRSRRPLPHSAPDPGIHIRSVSSIHRYSSHLISSCVFSSRLIGAASVSPRTQPPTPSQIKSINLSQ